jgi:hypothetical protein
MMLGFPVEQLPFVEAEINYVGDDTDGTQRDRYRVSDGTVVRRLLATQGVCDFEPIRKHRRQRLEKSRRWDGEPLPSRFTWGFLSQEDYES